MVKHEIKRITHYEYWSWWVYYLPLTPWYLWYSLKSKSLLYFTTVNPKMKFGGMFNYSKYKVQHQIPLDFRPQHILIRKDNFDIKNINIAYPFIAKPDKGQRGENVQIIKNEEDLHRYIKLVDDDILLQNLIEDKLEFGLFYVRHPRNQRGNIISITGKEFLTYKGDGTTSLREFIESDSRAYFNKSYLYMKFHDQQDVVLPKGENLLLEPIGNHNRGTYFYDASDLKTEQLEGKLDEIAQGIEGFFYGRFDVKAKSLEDLKAGKFTILEVNGANSEPTHIYDSKFSLLQSYREVLRHLKQQYLVSSANMEQGIKPDGIGDFVTEYYNMIFDYND